MKILKKLILAFVLFMLIANTASADFFFPRFWKEKDATTIQPEEYSEGNEYDVEIEDLTVTGVFIIGGTMGSDLDMDGYTVISDTDGDWLAIIGDRHASISDDEFGIGKTGAIDFIFGVDLLTLLSGTNIIIETGSFQTGTSTQDTATWSMIKGAQTGDPSFQISLSADDQGDVTMVADTGDITTTADNVILNAATAVLTVSSLFQMGSATVDTGFFRMIKGAQTGDPQMEMGLSNNDQGDFFITADTGNIALVSQASVDLTGFLTTTSHAIIGSTIRLSTAYLSLYGDLWFATGGDRTITLQSAADDTAGNNLTVNGADAGTTTAAGVFDGGGLIRQSGQGSSAWVGGGSEGGAGGDIEDILAIGGTGDGVASGAQGEYYLRGSNQTIVANYYNTVTPPGGDLTNLKFWGKDDVGATVQYAQITVSAVTTGDGTHDSEINFGVIQGGNPQTGLGMYYSSVDSEFLYELAEDVGVFMTPITSDDTNATGYISIGGSDGGESTTGGGYDGQPMEIFGGFGTDAFDGATDGGDGKNLYAFGGLHGSLSGAGADGADGNAVLGYSGVEAAVVGKVLVGTDTLDGSSAIFQVLGLINSTAGVAEALRLSTNADDYTGFTMDANGGVTIQSVDAAAAAANIAIIADGTYAVTSTGYNLSSAGAISGVTDISMTGELDLTGALAKIDLNPDATGDQNVIDITPTAALEVDIIWRGINIDGGALDPLAGGALPTFIRGFTADFRDVVSVDGDRALVYGASIKLPIGDEASSKAFVHFVTEMTVDGEQTAFYSLGGIQALSATATYRGFWFDWNTITRNAGAPVMEGLRVEMPNDYTDFGTSFGAYFKGDGNEIYIADDDYALFVDVGVSRFNGMVLSTQGTDETSANDITLDEDANYYDIVGNTQINRIASGNWTAGTRITLQFDSNPLVKHNQAAGGGFASIQISGSADYQAATGSMIDCIYDGTDFNCWPIFTP